MAGDASPIVDVGVQRRALLGSLLRVFAEFVDDEPALFQSVAEQLTGATGDATTVRLLSADGTVLDAVAVHHVDPVLKAALADIMARTTTPANSGIWQAVIEERATLRFPVSVQTPPPNASPEQLDFIARYPARQFMAVPLVARGRAIGGISLVRFIRDEPFTDGDEAFLRELADRAAVSIDNARLLSASRRTQSAAERAEAAAHRDERRRQAVLDAALDAIVTIDTAGAVLEWNPSAERMFGYARAHAVGRMLGDLIVPPAQREAHRVGLARVANGGAPRILGRALDLTAQRADGTEFPAEVSLVRIEEHPPLFTAFIRDVTDRKRAEQELQRSNTELEQFAHVASHDLQEPLRMVAIYCELLAQRYAGKLDERADKYIKYAVDGAHRMQQLVKDLLIYSRAGAPVRDMAPVSLSRVVEAVIDDLQVALDEAGAGVTRGALPDVIGDEQQLRQLLQNLIANAIRYRAERRLHIEIGASLDAGRWRVTVRDNGAGIDPHYHQRVFEMFERLTPQDGQRGSGIGLSIAKRIVERHGGRIWVESEPDKGAAFHFTLTPAPPVGGGAAGAP